MRRQAAFTLVELVMVIALAGLFRVLGGGWMAPAG